MSDPVSAIGGAVSLGGSLLQSNSASDAADAQSAAAAAATAEQRRQYDLTRADQKPFLQTGTAANQRLGYLLGLNPTGGATTNRDTIAQQLGYSTSLQPSSSGASASPLSQQDWANAIGDNSITNGTKVAQTNAQQKYQDYLNNFKAGNVTPAGTQGYTADQNTAIDKAIADQASTQANDPNYGSLAKSFGMSDYQEDPGYAFRLSEGQKALDRAAAAKGGFNSGAAAKALIDYNQNMGSQEYGNAYNRYNTNQTNLYNRLQGLAGGGQTAANTLATTGANTANAISGNINAAGNAQAAGSIAGGNAWSTGLNNIASGLYGSNNSTNATNGALYSSINNPANSWMF